MESGGWLHNDVNMLQMLWPGYVTKTAENGAKLLGPIGEIFRKQ
jgi:hypothetical protein